MHKYFFLHIPKTAGTSIFTLLRSVLGAEQVYQVRDVNIDRPRAKAIQSFALIGGHLTYDQMQSYFEPERYRFTILRNPVDSFLSTYYFFRSVEEVNRNLAVRNAKVLDLAAYIEWLAGTEEYLNISSAQTWYLTGNGLNKMPINERLDLAKKNLASLDFVGIVEHMADSIDLISLDCGWPAVKKIPRENVTVQRLRKEEVSSDILRRIREISGPDLDLYDYGLSLYEKKKRQLLRECVQRHAMVIRGDDGTIEQEVSCSRLSAAAPLYMDKIRTEEDFGTQEIEIISANVCGLDSCCSIIQSGEEALIRILIRSQLDEKDISVDICLKDDYGLTVFGSNNSQLEEPLSIRKGQILRLDYRLAMNIGEGNYFLSAAVHSGRSRWQTCYQWKERLCDFTISGFKGRSFQGSTRLQPILSYESVASSEALPAESTSLISLQIEKTPTRIPIITRFNVLVNVTNESDYELTSYPPNPLHLSYHWLKVTGGETVIFEGKRSFFLKPLSPHTAGSYGLSVVSPQIPGEYILRVTLVQELVMWFDHAGNVFADYYVSVT